MRNSSKLKITAFLLLAAAILGAGSLYISGQLLTSAEKSPQAVQGLFDLEAWYFKQKGIVSLEGQWEFYWQQLLTPKDFKEGQATTSRTGYITVPGIWNGYVPSEDDEKHKLPGAGYATYRLVINTNTVEPVLGLKILEFATSHRLWVNDELLSENGRVGINKEETTPQAFPRLINFKNDSGTIEIILQIANFTHRKGGIWTDIKMGTPEQLQLLREKQAFSTLFLCGGLLIMAVYHFWLYLLRRKDRAPLFCALLCILIAARASVTSEIFILSYLPKISWNMIYIVQYLGFYLALPVFIQFIRILYPLEMPAKPVTAAWVLGFLASLTVLLTPPKIYTWLMLPYEVYAIALLLFVLGAVLVRALVRRREGAALFLLGTIAIVLVVIHDSLVSNEILWGPYIADYGVFIFIFCQCCVLSMRFARSFATVEKLSEEMLDKNDELLKLANERNEALVRLEEYSQNLEKTVLERTSELAKAKEDADFASRAKSDFLATVSHEIRTPMNGMVGMLELLEATPLNKEQKECFSVIKDCSGLLLSLINDILDLSRIEKGALSLEERDFEPKNLEHYLVHLIEPMASKRGLVFVSDFSPGLPPVLKGDPVRLRQVLLNLLNNAVKFTEKGSITLRVLVEQAGMKQVNVTFEVEDTGPGIPEKIKSSIFQPFTQGHAWANSSHGGAGLGLSICKRLVELMGGQIYFTSTKGAGTLFGFTIPLKDSASEPGLPEKDLANPETALSYYLENSPGTILIVDDFEFNRRVLSMQLKKLGLEAETAARGQEAVEMLSQKRYALVLMDCRIPGMDGFQTTALIREMEAGQNIHTPIVAITAGATSGEKERCLAAGMDDYLSKPVRLDELSGMLARWLPGTGNSGWEALEGALAESAASRQIDLPSFVAAEKREELLQAVGRDYMLLSRVLAAFLRDMPQKFAALEIALKEKDVSNVRVLSHGMKSSGLFIGAASFAAFCKALEDLVDSGTLQGAGILVEKIRQELLKIQKEMEQKKFYLYLS